MPAHTTDQHAYMTMSAHTTDQHADKFYVLKVVTAGERGREWERKRGREREGESGREREGERERERAGEKRGREREHVCTHTHAYTHESHTKG